MRQAQLRPRCVEDMHTCTHPLHAQAKAHTQAQPQAHARRKQQQQADCMQFSERLAAKPAQGPR